MRPDGRDGPWVSVKPAGARSTSDALWTLAAAASVAVRVAPRLGRPGLLAVRASGWLPVGAALVSAVFARRRIVRAAGLAAAATWVLPAAINLHQALRRRARTSNSAQLVVVAANLLWENVRHDELALALLRTNADVVVTIETTPAARAVLDARFDGVYRPVSAEGTDLVVVIWVREGLPASVEPSVVLPRRRLPVVKVSFGERAAWIVGVHLQSPGSPAKVRQWRSELDGLARWSASQSAALIMAGDFNASLDHGELRPLTASGCVDAARASGRLWPRTWPCAVSATTRWTRPLLWLDHVLVRGELRVVDYDEIELPGSDHRGVVATLVPHAGGPILAHDD
jgi:endonuclease/exonuclease/phosphatase (EEP) superfamily protein YafD